MNRRQFSKGMVGLAMGIQAGLAEGAAAGATDQPETHYEEPARKLSAREFDVVVAGAGTAGVELLREHVPGCEKAFIARTSPSLCIRRGRRIACDYDITHEDVVEARHFPDDVHRATPSKYSIDGRGLADTIPGR